MSATEQNFLANLSYQVTPISETTSTVHAVTFASANPQQMYSAKAVANAATGVGVEQAKAAAKDKLWATLRSQSLI